jgi:hypothetical protein
MRTRAARSLSAAVNVVFPLDLSIQARLEAGHRCLSAVVLPGNPFPFDVSILLISPTGGLVKHAPAASWPAGVRRAAPRSSMPLQRISRTLAAAPAQLGYQGTPATRGWSGVAAGRGIVNSLAAHTALAPPARATSLMRFTRRYTTAGSDPFAALC